MVIQKKLQGLEKITEFIKICIASSNIKNEKPISALIVAPVSSGKTTAVKQFKINKNLLITTDSTAYGILKNYQKELKNREIRFIIIPDLLNALSRKKQTAEQLILLINASSEDGLFPSKSYGIELNDYIEPFGWLLCVTEEAYKKKRKFLDSIGFSSRFFTLQYKYSIEQIQNILRSIIEEEKFKIPEIEVKSGKNQKEIKGNSAIFQEASVYSKLLCKNGEAEILRMQKKLQVFLKSCAYLRNDNQVKREDLDKLKELIELIKND